jgi:hypothetical protein
MKKPVERRKRKQLKQELEEVARDRSSRPLCRVRQGAEAMRRGGIAFIAVYAYHAFVSNIDPHKFLHQTAMFARGKVTAHLCQRSGFFLASTARFPRIFLTPTANFDDGFDIPATGRAQSCSSNTRCIHASFRYCGCDLPYLTR